MTDGMLAPRDYMLPKNVFSDGILFFAVTNKVHVFLAGSTGHPRVCARLPVRQLRRVPRHRPVPGGRVGLLPASGDTHREPRRDDQPSVGDRLRKRLRGASFRHRILPADAGQRRPGGPVRQCWAVLAGPRDRVDVHRDDADGDDRGAAAAPTQPGAARAADQARGAADATCENSRQQWLWQCQHGGTFWQVVVDVEVVKWTA